MTSGPSELVMVLPTDSIESVADTLRATKAHAVQLLVADNTPAFQSLDGLARLQQFAAQNDIQITLFSSDERTLDAARIARFDIVAINGARVSPGPENTQAQPAAPPFETQPAPYATRAFPRDELEVPISEDDADFLDELDRLPESDYDGLDDPLDADFDDFDDLPPSSGRRAPVDDFDDDLDEDDLPPRRRSFEDIEDVTPVRVPRRGRSEPIPARAPLAPSRRRATPSYEDDDYPVRGRSGGGVLLPLLFGVVLALGLGAFWFYTNRPTVLVWPPPSEVNRTTFTGEVIGVGEAPGDAETTSVQAVPVNASAEVTVQGRASQQLAPVGTARGTVQIINTLSNSIDLPDGTQFIATNAQGQQVSFLIDGPAQVPPATTTSSLFGTSIQFGNVEVQVSARSPGSASNVGENTITQLIVPGQPPITSNDSVRMLNRPLEGGSEEQLYIVSEQDVRAVLGEGLTQLYQAGVAALQSQQAASGFVLDTNTVNPNPQALADPVNYEPPVVNPPVGQPVDQANPVFTMVLRANFNALAAPPDKPVENQLRNLLATYLYQQNNGNLCPQNDKLGVDMTQYVWDGQQLAVDGAVTCTPAGALPDETLAQVRNALVGQPYDSAVASLEQLQRNGAIGGYQLPQIESFPRFAFLMRVERAPADAPSPNPAEGQPVETTPAETAPIDPVPEATIAVEATPATEATP